MTTNLTISSRAYMLVRSMSVQSVADALVELVTNADDAYQTLFEQIAAGTVTTPWTSRGALGDIEIEFHAPTTILVRDHSIGMSGSAMVDNLLNVGNYTSSSVNNRGHFSRGAKDISALGDVTFHMIKNNLYSSCRINYDTTVEVLAQDVPVTEELRALHKIPVNGLSASINVRPEFIIQTPAEMLDIITNRVSLRAIINDANLHVRVRCFTDKAVKWVDMRVWYSFPTADPVLDITFNIPSYPHASAHLWLKKTSTRIKDSTELKGRSYGVVVASGPRINHDVTLFNPALESDESVHYVYGRLECPYIMELMRDLDVHAATTQNPFTVLDPSRQTGVNVDHPFIKEMFSVAGVHFQFYVNGVQDDLDKNVVKSNDISDLMKNLEQFGTQLIGSQTHIHSWRSARDAPYVRALNDVRTNFVTAESREIILARPPGYPQESNLPPLPVDLQQKIYDTTKPTQSISTHIVDQGNFVDGVDPDAEYISRVYESNFSFQIEFSTMENPTYKYSITKKEGVIKLRIFLKDALISKSILYDPVTEDVTNMKDPRVIQMIGGIVTEALSRLLVESDHSVNKDKFVTMMDSQVITSVMRNYEKKVLAIQVPVQATIDNYLANLVVDTSVGTSTSTE